MKTGLKYSPSAYGYLYVTQMNTSLSIRVNAVASYTDTYFPCSLHSVGDYLHCMAESMGNFASSGAKNRIQEGNSLGKRIRVPAV